jgi:predicted ATPase with chaperone activity
MGLSVRAHGNLLCFARTTADLDGSSEIQPEHVNEAVDDRVLDQHF